MVAYQDAKAQYDKDKAAYDTAKAKYDQDLAAYQQYITTIEGRNDVVKSTSDVVIYGSENQANQGSGNYYDYTVALKNNDYHKLDGSIGYHANSVVSANNATTEWSTTVANPKNASDVRPGINNLKAGDSIKMTNVATYDNGKPLHMIITFTDVRKGQVNGTTPGESQLPNVLWLLRNASNDALSFHTRGGQGDITQTFRFVNDAGESINLVTTVVIGDVDWHQRSTLTGVETLYSVVPDGSNLTRVTGDTLQGGNFPAEGLRSTPIGTYLKVLAGDTITYRHDGGQTPEQEALGILPGRDYQYDMFGSDAQFLAKTPPIPPRAPKAPAIPVGPSSITKSVSLDDKSYVSAATPGEALDVKKQDAAWTWKLDVKLSNNTS